MAVGSLRATVADAPAASTAERPAALCCSAGPRLVQVGRAQQQRTRGPPRGVQHTAIAASAAGACRLGRYRGQRGPAPLNPLTACNAAQNHKCARRVPGGPGQWLQRAGTGATGSTGWCGRAVRWQRKPQSKNTHARARTQTRTHVRTHAQAHTHLEKHHRHERKHHTETHTHVNTRTYTHSITRHTHTHTTHTHDTHTRTQTQVRVHARPSIARECVEQCRVPRVGDAAVGSGPARPHLAEHHGTGPHARAPPRACVHCCA